MAAMLLAPSWRIERQRKREVYCLIALVCLQGVARSEEAASGIRGKSRILFDAGADTPQDGGVALNATMMYAARPGYGWLMPPGKEFSRGDLSRSRPSLTMSGVAGRRMRFRADVDPGTWHVIVWLEAERMGSSSPSVLLQNVPRAAGWHRFAAENEPSASPVKAYRVFAATFEVKADGAVIELSGGRKNVGLLGISLTKHIEPSTPAQKAFIDSLTSAGGLASTTPMGELLRRADVLLKDSPDDALVNLCRQRIELLAGAERLTALRGWQSSDEATGLGWSDRVAQAIMLLDGLLGADNGEAGELSDRALFLRGRLLYWLGKERGKPNDVADARRDLARLFGKHPTDELLAMYNGKQIEVAGEFNQAAAGAPAWSAAQHEALCRLRALVGWWVDERQSATGEFGGKYDDDVELLRWWAPLALAGDETALRGWRRLADGVWQSGHVANGYARKLRDVEHAAELVADTAPLMAVYDDDARYLERLRPSTSHFKELWTGVTPRGHRHFRSAWFNATEIDSSEPKNRDVEYNTRAARALRYLAWRQRDPEVVELLHEWSLAWVEAAMRTDKGKPRGVIPPSIRFPDEAVNGDEATWYDAKMGWEYYDWQFNAGSSMLDQLFFTYLLTNDERLLTPMFSALELIKTCGGATSSPEGDYGKGTPAWAAAILAKNRTFWSVVEQWRFASGDARWDDLIGKYGTSYGRYRVTGDYVHLSKGIQQVLEQVRYNRPLLTTEVLFTDRVYVPGWECLKAMLTGDGTPENASPYFAASWEKTSDGFTALVNESTASKLDVEIFSHAVQDSSAVLRLWKLSPGDYIMASRAADGTTHSRPVQVKENGQRVSLPVPAKRLLKLTVSPRG